MLDLRSEKPLKLSAACRTVIAEFVGGPVAPQTAVRWVHRGLLAADGTRVVLQAVKVGRSYLTSEAAVERFFALLARHTADARDTSGCLADSETDARLRAVGLRSL